jgi:dTDP-4-amino-4,6-dideoxygalactose transaminase
MSQRTETNVDLPAIAGGTPVRAAPFRAPNRYGEDELRELRAALDQGTLFYAHGGKVKQLEAESVSTTGAKFAVACSSGTTAIHAAMIAAGISPCDEVIAPPVTDMGSIIPILWQGAVPVFADLDPHTYNLAPRAVEQCITAKTRAILAVHLAGNPCDLRALRELSQRHRLMLIEDCAQAHAARYAGQHVGTIGDFGCFSFNEFKHISCGDGGIVATNDERAAHRLRLATDKGYDRTAPAETIRHAPFLANNYRMTELQAAVAVAQLRKLPSIVERRRRWCDALGAQIGDVKGLELPRVTDGCEPSWWFYLMRVAPAALGADAETFAAALRAEGLPVSAHYTGQCVYEYPMFANHRAFDHGPPHPFAAQDYRKGLCPTAEAILETAVLLNIHEAYGDEELRQAVRAIRRVAQWFNERL